MAGTKDTSKRPVGLRVAPPVLDMVDDLAEWLGAPSKAWVWETAIIRWHTEEKARRDSTSTGDHDEEVTE